MANVKPLNEFITLKIIIVPEGRTASGLVVPRSQADDPFGEVLAISEDILEDDERKVRVKVGDKIVLNRHQIAQKVNVDGQEILFLPYKTILGVFA